MAAQPRLRVGIIGDSQGVIRTGSLTPRQKLICIKYHDRNLKKTEQALGHLQKLGVDVLLNVGDLSENGAPELYSRYLKILDRTFKNASPVHIICMGNHDFWTTPRNDRLAQKNFCRAFGQDSVNSRKVIDGYTFIAVSSENGELHGTYSAPTAQFLDRALADAVANDPAKPIFVITHQPPRNTVYGSSGEWGSAFFDNAFKPYVQVVNFSGHLHYPVADERSIFQQDYTAIGSGCLSYCVLESGKEGGGVPEHAEKNISFLYMEVYLDRLVIRRFDALSGREIKPEAPWIVKLPQDKADFIHTDRRAHSRPAPEFPAAASGKVKPDKVPFQNLLLSIDAAEHPDFVHSYAVKIERRNADGSFQKENSGNELLFFSDFVDGPDHMSRRPEFKLDGKYFQGNTDYKLQILPIESFGKRGNRPLTVEFTTPEKLQ